MSYTIQLTPLPDTFLYDVAQNLSGRQAVKQHAIIDAIWPVYIQTLKAYDIATDFRVVYFTGQICHESDQFTTTVEYASGAAYEGRHDLGNTQPGDGIRFKGRGLIQLTGRANYETYGQLLQLDLVNQPELAAEPVNALKLACLYWQKHGLSALADVEDLEGITRKINGGLNGLAARSAATDRAFQALGYVAS